MSDVGVLVVRAAGINCDEEVLHCWRVAGAAPSLVHVNELAAAPSMLDAVQIVTLPGGFSFGDDIAAGAILAQRLALDLAEPLQRLVDRGGGILGICNGLQVLVKMGLLPGGAFGRDKVTVTYNESARFEARWTRLAVCTDRCPFLARVGRDSSEVLELPVEHGEGRVVTANESVREALEAAGLIALRYVDAEGRFETYPANPNGSDAGIAGLCDRTGRILGLMPHPDRYFDPAHHPLWTRHKSDTVPDGLRVFQDAVRYWRGG